MDSCFSLVLRWKSSMQHCVILCKSVTLDFFSTCSIFQSVRISVSLSLTAFLCGILYGIMEPEGVQGWLPWHKEVLAQTWCFFHTITCSLDFSIFLHVLHHSRMSWSQSAGEPLLIVCISFQLKDDNVRNFQKMTAPDQFSLSLIL